MTYSTEKCRRGVCSSPFFVPLVYVSVIIIAVQTLLSVAADYTARVCQTADATLSEHVVPDGNTEDCIRLCTRLHEEPAGAFPMTG